MPPCRIQSPVETERVLAEVRNTIRSYPFDFRGARIISGAEEGAYGWITINYLLSSFIKFSYEGKWKHPKNGKILGALDLGGASTQITFTPKEQIKDNQSEASFRLYGYEHTVYTHSFLCYGKEQFMNKILAKLVKENNISSPVPHPCFPTGYQLNTTLGEIFSSPCPSKPDPYSPTSAVTFMGSGTPAQCEALVKTAFSGFFYTFDFLKLAPQSSLDVTRKTVAEFCRRDWNSLKAEFPSEKDSRLREYCGAGYYITTLLVDAYKFDNQSWNNIVFQKKADDTDIGWTLGYMLNLTNLIPSEAPPEVKGQDYDVWVGLVFVIVLAIAVSLLAIAVQCLGNPK
ncbi:ENTP8 diphosphohydrolase, partial [Polyodon spathula]|nr:ENTP8 diphosphohydrolase [Polyodon spathula]